MSVFKQRCREVVDEYVQTVLIIDDGAGLENKNTAPTETKAEAIDMDDELRSPFVEASAKAPKVPTATPTAQEITHSLNALELTSAFYELGIVAGLYQPQIQKDDTPEMFASKAKKVSVTADIIILDWMLVDHDSNYSKAIVKQIIEQDLELGGRLRTIVIYTGESNLHRLKNDLWDYLGDISLDKSHDYEITSKYLSIVFYNKNHVTGERQVSEQDLPPKTLEAFSFLVDGLIPSFAMKAAGAIRNNTGRIISRFGKDLDAAYLSHRVLLSDPEDSEVFMLEHFISYMRNILAIGRVDNFTLGADAIEPWVEHNFDLLSKKVVQDGNEYTLEKSELIKLCRDGFDDNLYQVLSGKKPNISAAFKDFSKTASLKAISIFDKEGYTARNSSIELSVLSVFRRTYQDIVNILEIPYLTQGTLIYSKFTDKFLLCVTPKCDTVRIDKEKKFSFVVLEETDGSKFDMVVPMNNFVAENKEKVSKRREEEVVRSIIDDRILNNGKTKNYVLYDDLASLRKKQYDKYVYLRTSSKFYALEHVIFECNENKRVLGINQGDELIEFWDQDCNDYIWLGDLHDLNTISRVGKLITNLNRAGTDEVEWLRRQYQ